jgi:hypothetical protein
LAQLADRVLYILVNLILCKRAFSALNQLYIKTRNALTPEQVDKLLYIQINSRTLRRDALVGKRLKDENDEDEDEDKNDNLVVDGEEGAILTRPAHTKEALPGPDGLNEGSQHELM